MPVSASGEAVFICIVAAVLVLIQFAVLWSFVSWLCKVHYDSGDAHGRAEMLRGWVREHQESTAWQNEAIHWRDIVTSQVEDDRERRRKQSVTSAVSDG